MHAPRQNIVTLPLRRGAVQKQQHASGAARGVRARTESVGAIRSRRSGSGLGHRVETTTSPSLPRHASRILVAGGPSLVLRRIARAEGVSPHPQRRAPLLGSSARLTSSTYRRRRRIMCRTAGPVSARFDLSSACLPVCLRTRVLLPWLWLASLFLPSFASNPKTFGASAGGYSPSVLTRQNNTFNG